MHCQTCDTVNTADARFCRTCGATLVEAAPRYTTTKALMTGPACPHCYQRNPSGARFCVFCATPIGSEQLTASSPTPLSYAPAGGGTAVATINYMPMQPIQMSMDQTVNLAIRAIWFVMIGWWLGLFWMIGAWMFNVTVIGLPVGLMMLHSIPQVMTLRPRSRSVATLQLRPDGTLVAVKHPEHPFLLRAIWFVLIGWWASLVWSLVAWGFSATIILLPIAFWMFDRVPTITTLAVEQ